jgi:phosphoglycerate kinase
MVSRPMLDLDVIRRLPQLDVAGRRVFVRADLDSTFSAQGAVRDDLRLVRLLPTLRYLASQRAKVVVATRLVTAGREASRLAIQGLADRLAELLGEPVRALSASFERELKGLAEGQVTLAPDLSIFPEEIQHDEAWARRLASAIDVYVLDGLEAARAGGTSVVELPSLICSRGVGLAIVPALDLFHDAVAAPAPEPYTFLFGGQSLRQVEPVIRAVLPLCKDLLLGGAVANTLLVAQGWRPGGSPHDPSEVTLAGEVLALAHAHGVTVHTPLDAVIRKGMGAAATHEQLALDRALLPEEAAVDLGDETCSAYEHVLVQSATVLWVGLLGDCSRPESQRGSLRLGQLAALAPRAMAAGDETVQAIRDFRLDRQVRTAAGGETVLALLGGEAFPGFEVLSR